MESQYFPPNVNNHVITAQFVPVSSSGSIQQQQQPKSFKVEGTSDAINVDKVEFEIEAIRQRRVINNKEEYYVKWKGYSEENNTWEAAENLHCQSLIQAFHASLSSSTNYPKTNAALGKHHCSMCDRYFYSNFTLRRHQQKIHQKTSKDRDSSDSPLPNESETNSGGGGGIGTSSGINFRGGDILSAAFAEVKRRPSAGNYQCLTCDRKFYSNYSLRRHQTKVHWVFEPNVDEHLMHICGHCGRGFRTASALTSHQRLAHGATTSAASAPQPPPPQPQPPPPASKPEPIDNIMSNDESTDAKHQCPTCGKQFTRFFSLQRHQNVHLREGREPALRDATAYLCSLCGKSFPRLYSLERHRKVIHRKGVKYACVICGQEFRYNMLLKHQQTHKNVVDVKQIAMREMVDASIADAVGSVVQNMHQGRQQQQQQLLLQQQLQQHQQQQQQQQVGRSTTNQWHNILPMITLKQEPTIVLPPPPPQPPQAPSTISTSGGGGRARRQRPCPICLRNFYSNFTLKRHQKVHQNNGDGLMLAISEAASSSSANTIVPVDNTMVVVESIVHPLLSGGDLSKAQLIYQTTPHQWQNAVFATTSSTATPTTDTGGSNLTKPGPNRRQRPCHICGRDFYSNFTLRRHQEKVHHNVLSIVHIPDSAEADVAAMNIVVTTTDTLNTSVESTSDGVKLESITRDSNTTATGSNR